MIICLGPVCIPLWGLLPFLMVYFWKIWDWLKVKLGLAPAPAVKTEGTGAAKDQGTSAEDTHEDSATSNQAAPDKKHTIAYDAERDTEQCSEEEVMGMRGNTSESVGKVIVIDSMEHYQSLKATAFTEGVHLVTKYTAEWCQPCKRISPMFHALATRHKAVFIEVDVDEHSEIMPASVKALPAFTIEHNTEKVQTSVGPTEKELEAFAQEHLPSMK